MNDDAADRALIVLRAESADLDDAGLAGYLAAEGIDPCGDRILFLACKPLLGDASCPLTAVAPEHEQLGQLDWRLRDRIGLSPLRCGRRTRSGGRCRVIVGKPGDACHWHRGGDESC
jgi:hypothetical protein